MMKRLFALLVCLTLLVFSGASIAAASEANPYAPYASHQELLEAYDLAVEEGDFKKQEELLSIGRKSLDLAILTSEEALAASPMPLADTEDYSYWLGQFPIYFSNGEWITRDRVVSLSLYPINPAYWTQAQAGRAWYSTYVKFSESTKWANTSVMKDQFYCHWTLAIRKSPWNLEPSKTSINPVTCN